MSGDGMERNHLPPVLAKFSPFGAVISASWVVAFVALQRWAHWDAWAAGLVPLGAVILLRIAMDVWPRKVPPELADDVAKLGPDGWRLLRYHPFLCTEKRPHVHLMKGGGKPVMVTHLGASPARQHET